MRANLLFLSRNFENNRGIWQVLQEISSYREIDADFAEISTSIKEALIPRSLEGDGDAWFVFFGKKIENEILVFPTPKDLHEPLEKSIDQLLEDIMGERNKRWYANVGFRNLSVRLSHYKRHQEVQLYSTPPRQVLNFDHSVYDIIEHGGEMFLKTPVDNSFEGSFEELQRSI